MRNLFFLFLFKLFFYLLYSSLNYNNFDYPSYIPLQERRKDIYTNKEVNVGRFELIGSFSNKPNYIENNNNKKITIKKFKKELQCLNNENYFERSGPLHLMKLIKPTKELIEQMSAWCETQCLPWADCHQHVKDFKNGSYPSSFERIDLMSSGSPYQVKLLRFIKGKLYLDWPWGVERFQLPYGSIYNPLIYLTNVIKDLPDIFFFIGVERSWLPAHFPFPGFSNSPSTLHGDLPFPWYVPLTIQIKTYQNVIERNLNFTFESFLSASQFGEDIKWENKINKCAYFGTLTENRQIFFHHTLLRPDLFDIGWTTDFMGPLDWNPLSNSSTRLNSDTIKEYEELLSKADLKTNNSKGYNINLVSKRLKNGINFVKQYKYIVVLTGLNGGALSGSLNNLLFQSGAVILLQYSPYIYHYSHYLKPWIHYVPISITGDDIIEKVEWLQKHPILARRIAHNARIFGQSYLRLEDYFCYFINIIESISRVVNGTTALEPFNPIEIKPEFDRWQ